MELQIIFVVLHPITKSVVNITIKTTSMNKKTEKELLEGELVAKNATLTERQRLHLSVVLEMSLSTLRIYLNGSVAKEKTAREIIKAIKSLKKGKRVSIA